MIPAGRAILLVLAACACRPSDRPKPVAGARALASTLAHPDSGAAVVRGRTVVVFWLPASDTLDRRRAADLLDDFREQTAGVSEYLDESGIALVATTADSMIVELAGGPRRVIRLSGLDFPFGYVLVEPGYPETILTGVSTSEELLDQVDWYFGLDEEDAEGSGEGRISGPGSRAPAPPALPARTASAETRCWAGTRPAGGWSRRCSPRHTAPGVTAAASAVWPTAPGR
jgi:hypothetical protein